MSKLKSTILAALVLFATITGTVALAGTAAATDGDVTVSVLDDESNAVAGATVTMYNAADDTQADTGETGTDGTVTFAAVAHGDYYVEADAPDHEPATGATFTVDGAHQTTVTISEVHSLTITFDQTDWDEIVVSNVQASHSEYENVTEQGDELPDIDLSVLENGTEVTFNWGTVEADGLSIDDAEGQVITHNNAALSDDTGTLTVEWDTSLNDDADAYRFANATAYDNEDTIGTFGGSMFSGSVSGATDSLSSISPPAGMVIGAFLIALFGAIIAKVQ